MTSSITWSSSDTTIATINATGLVNAADVGTSTITATDAATGISGSTTLTGTPAELVSIEVTPTNPSIPSGRNQQFTATGTFTDGTTQDLMASTSWTSSDTIIARVSNTAGSEGLAKGLSDGTTTIMATDPATGSALV